MNKKLTWVTLLFFAIPVVFSLNMVRVYPLHLIYDGQISLASNSLDFGYLPDKINMPEDGYTLKLMDVRDQPIYEYKFAFSTALFISESPECFDSEGVYDSDLCGPSYQELSETEEIINVPYSMIGKQINIYDPSDKLVLAIDVSNYSDYCGDGKCSVIESHLSCEIDCESNAATDQTEERKLDWDYITIGCIILIILTALVFFKVKKI